MRCKKAPDPFRAQKKGFEFRKGITDLGAFKYVMAAGPDGVLLELFETTAF